MVNETEQFLEFETKEKLFDKQINGTYYWNIVRFFLYERILECKKNLGRAHDHQYSIKTLIGNAFNFIPHLFFKNPLWFLPRKDILIINHPRRVKIDGQYHCIYTDQLINHLNNSYIVFEAATLPKHKTPVPTRHLRYFDYIDWKRRFVFYMGRKKQLSTTQIGELTAVVRQLNAFFDIDLSIDTTVNRMAKAILFHQIYVKNCTKILKKVQPQLILEVVGYSQVCQAFNEAARQLGIRTIELQHGTMGGQHISYNFTHRQPIDTFPDSIFLFGEFWKNTTRLPLCNDNIKVVGWPFYEQKVIESVSDNRPGTPIVILFLSQGTIGRELSQMAAELATRLDRTKYEVIYKLHPGEFDRWKSDYPWLSEQSLTLIDHSEVDIHHYLAHANIQIGVYSTAIYEGLGYGLRTFIWKLPEYERMQELLDSKIAELVCNCDELIERLNTPEYPSGKMNISSLWKPNSLSNILNEINKAMR